MLRPGTDRSTLPSAASPNPSTLSYTTLARVLDPGWTSSTVTPGSSASIPSTTPPATVLGSRPRPSPRPPLTRCRFFVYMYFWKSAWFRFTRACSGSEMGERSLHQVFRSETLDVSDVRDLMFRFQSSISQSAYNSWTDDRVLPPGEISRRWTSVFVLNRQIENLTRISKQASSLRHSDKHHSSN